jgi:hypothetical protein
MYIVKSSFQELKVSGMKRKHHVIPGKPSVSRNVNMNALLAWDQQPSS